MPGSSILVVGGNGFLGSAICKAAVAQGYSVSSMSAYKTPAGHTPKWVNSVKWHRASAFDPSTYRDLISSSEAVVHTLGTLLEDAGYKAAIRNNDVFGIIGALGRGLSGDRNPLMSKEEKMRSYEGMNRDSALMVLRTMLEESSSIASSSSTSTAATSAIEKPFVYISAADCFRPLIPRRYIDTKRQAEGEILRMTMPVEEKSSGVRPVFIRPGLMYHPHIRPLSTLPAFGLSLTATLHDRIPLNPPLSETTAIGGIANALKTHPLHVDHVAEAVIRCIADPSQRGAVEVDTMRSWAGFGKDKPVDQYVHV